METLALNLPIGPTPPRRGRPPGARNKRSVDLARYVEAQFGGMTPGQQAAALGLVTPKEVKRARAEAKELAIVDLGLADHVLAMVVKAHKLSGALGIERGDAWLLMMKEREGLMPYVHQRRAPAEAEKASDGPRVTAYVLEDGPAPQLAAPGEDPDELSFIGKD